MLDYKFTKNTIDELFRNKNNKNIRKRYSFRNDNK